VPTTVWFETHSTTTDNENGRATGWLPGELSAAGREQARALGDRIAGRRPAAVFTSDLRRAVDTVTIATEHPGVAGVPVFLDWRLRECDYGDLNGTDHGPVQDRRADQLVQPYPAGESWTAAVGRASEAVLDAVGLFPGRVIVVVGHVATRWAIDTLAANAELADLIGSPFHWQPGWKHLIDVPVSRARPRSRR
jgi:broad specificity phosphatase PhoE